MSIQSTYFAVGLFLSLFIALALCRETCYETYTREYYCTDGYECCGVGNTRCCAVSTIVLSGGAYAGISIGGIIVLIIFVAICCAVVKQKNHNGMVVQPATNQVLTVHNVQNVQRY